MEAWEEVSYRQSILEALSILKGPWIVAVIATMAVGEVRYKDLLSNINEAEERAGWPAHDTPLRKRTLTATLKRAQDAGLVERLPQGSTTFDGVRYRLTTKGQSLLLALQPLASWNLQYHHAVNDRQVH
jgi:DNA-binding HxlR family transcriptional regulator